MIKQRNNKRLLYILLTLFLLVVTIIGGRGAFPAFADTVGYSSALEDLQKDSSFNANNYPDNAKDYSIKVIQVAEGENGELFLYTYQPSQNTKYLVATEINMSLSETAEGTKFYGLAMVSCSGVFAKYLVKVVKVSDSATRYYNIASISRTWDKDIDKGTDNNNTKNSVSFAVGKCFKATTLNGSVLYHCTVKDVVEIKNPYHDFLRYSNGFKFFPESCDGHYIAFSTDRRIDRLIEAEVYYKSQSITFNNPFGDRQDNQVKLSDIDEASNEADGWFAVKHTWKRIESVNEFISNEELTASTKKTLEDKQWVLRFAETKYMLFRGTNGLAHLESYTEVSDVSILRLEFESDGVTYNLGAVSDKVTGDNVPGNVVPPENSSAGSGFFNYIWNCLSALFSGKSSVIETIVAVIALAVALFVFALAVWFIKKIYRLLFK